MYEAAYVPMNCIGDYADFVVYQDYNKPISGDVEPNRCSWMVPGSWEGRDEFGRKEAE